MSTVESAPKPCHNCRRQRRKCDRTLPECLKCGERGQECLGYQRLLRWDQGVASRGKLRGKTFESLLDESNPQLSRSPSSTHFRGRQISMVHSVTTSPFVLMDPLVQDLDETSRRLLSYFATHTCLDFVLYDGPHSNPLRELIPLTRYYPGLLQIIIANSALHMSNASAKFLPAQSQLSSARSATESLQSSSYTTFQIEHCRLALLAKQQAIVLLSFAISTMTLDDIDIILAIVLLFIQCELMDSGQSDWKHHVHGARSLINMVYNSGDDRHVQMSPLRRYLISNCLIYDIFGSTLTTYSDGLVPVDMICNGALSLLQDAEGNHCSSFPITLLQLIHEGAKLYLSETSPQNRAAGVERRESARSLLESAKSFDPGIWATSLQERSPVPDLELRTHIASAHRSATCIYLSRILLSHGPSSQISECLDEFVAQVRIALSIVPTNSPLFAATAWPTFIAGAEANSTASEHWVRSQFQDLWAIQPWGLVKGALVVLEMIWSKRRQERDQKGAMTLIDTKICEANWVGYIKDAGVDWLIL